MSVPFGLWCLFLGLFLVVRAVCSCCRGRAGALQAVFCFDMFFGDASPCFRVQVGHSWQPPFLVVLWVCLLSIFVDIAFAPFGVAGRVFIHSMESLILAQDERWRRA